MTFGLVVEWPVTGAFGTDAEFDLRTLFERDLGSTLAAESAGECTRCETDDGLTRVHVEAVADHTLAFLVVKRALAAHELLDRATVVLETRSKADPDEANRRVLWPVSATRVA